MAGVDTEWQAQRDVLSSNRYMFENHVACDVTFYIGKERQEVTAHKYVLISRSSVFYALLCGPLQETGPINIADAEPEVFEQLLRFIYYEAFEPKVDSIFGLLYAAKKYAVMCLVEKCVNWLKEGVSPDNVCGILQRAHVFNEQDVEKNCLDFIMDNGSVVLKHPSFRDLSPECVEMVVKQDQFQAKEEELYEAVKDWAGNECTRRNMQPTSENIRGVLGGLKNLIRFSLMNVKYFADRVAADDILSLEEKVNFFRSFHGSSDLDTTKYKHTTRKPRFHKMEQVLRFKRQDRTWFGGSFLDANEFKSSESVLLLGIVIYGSATAASDSLYYFTRDPFDLNIEVQLMDESKRSILSKTFNTKISINESKEILFDEGVVLHCSWYTITLRVSRWGATSDDNGIKRVVVKDGHSIEFRMSSLSPNSEDVLSAEISGLLICRRQ